VHPSRDLPQKDLRSPETMLIVLGVADDPKFFVRLKESLLNIMTESGTELLKPRWRKRG
jgi:hypothetical protein